MDEMNDREIETMRGYLDQLDEPTKHVVSRLFLEIGDIYAALAHIVTRLEKVETSVSENVGRLEMEKRR